MKKTNNVISIEEYCERHGFIGLNDMTPTIAIIQRHLENIENTYGTDILKDIIEIMGLSNSAPVKRKKNVKAS